VQQLLRNIQESLGEGEYEVGYFYHHKGSNPAAANRLQRLVDQYPLYSKADMALMDLADSYSKMGSRFRAKSGEAYARLVREYPLSPYADEAKKKLKEMEMPVPEPDPAAVARMQYDQAHRAKLSLIGKSSGFLKRGPDVSAAAKTGNPTMTTMNPTVPASVPIPAGATGFTGEVTASQVTGTSALDTQPDARTAQPASGSPAEGATPAATTPAASSSTSGVKPNEPLPQNANYTARKKKKNKKQTTQAAPAATTTAPAPAAVPPANP
jgi:outer membrane protein assembly factor BamD